MEDNQKAMTPVSEAVMSEMLLEEKMKTAYRRTKTERTLITPPSKTTERNVKAKLNIHGRHAQNITPARLAALFDLRLHYRQACGILAFLGDLPDVSKWNADATTMYVQEDNGKLSYGVFNSRDKTPFTTSEVSNDLGVFIKWIYLCNAAGHSGPLVLILAAPDMPEGEFFYRKVQGLSSSSNFQEYGHIYICNSRAGNGALWAHWFENIVIPTVEACNEVFQPKV